MNVSDFDFELPEALIAQQPPKQRGQSRLLVLHRSGAIEHAMFADLGRYLAAGDLLVLNNSRVFPARLLGHRIPTSVVSCTVSVVADGDELPSFEAADHLLPVTERAIIDPNTNQLLIGSVASGDGAVGAARDGNDDVVSYNLGTGATSRFTLIDFTLLADDQQRLFGKFAPANLERSPGHVAGVAGDVHDATLGELGRYPRRRAAQSQIQFEHSAPVAKRAKSGKVGIRNLGLPD